MVNVRGGWVSLAALLAVGLLTGCGGNGVAQDVRPGLPDGLDVDPTDTTIAATWLERGETFAIVTWGSSSCPPAASALTAEGSDRIAVTFAPSPNEVCTADMAPTTHEFELPDEVTRTTVTIDVSYEDSDETSTLTLE
ncbi:hypothetical protein [Mycetocola zhujimingii]|uniref:Lipoprotein n=1 Tax=Mycetocola zhujimingii TaxID=2079792 RepID=A0A2U1TE49_9MICO|nr:hypothetical protein [Mycetocola zhujimingii]PWC07159.1 hypothetical protein DF223_07715 [Mycetocola zhujimingii]